MLRSRGLPQRSTSRPSRCRSTPTAVFWGSLKRSRPPRPRRFSARSPRFEPPGASNSEGVIPRLRSVVEDLLARLVMARSRDDSSSSMSAERVPAVSSFSLSHKPCGACRKCSRRCAPRSRVVPPPPTAVSAAKGARGLAFMACGSSPPDSRAEPYDVPISACGTTLDVGRQKRARSARRWCLLETPGSFIGDEHVKMKNLYAALSGAFLLGSAAFVQQSTLPPPAATWPADQNQDRDERTIARSTKIGRLQATGRARHRRATPGFICMAEAKGNQNVARRSSTPSARRAGLPVRRREGEGRAAYNRQGKCRPEGHRAEQLQKEARTTRRRPSPTRKPSARPWLRPPSTTSKHHKECNDRREGPRLLRLREAVNTAASLMLALHQLGLGTPPRSARVPSHRARTTGGASEARRRAHALGNCRGSRPRSAVCRAGPTPASNRGGAAGSESRHHRRAGALAVDRAPNTDRGSPAPRVTT